MSKCTICNYVPEKKIILYDLDLQDWLGGLSPTHTSPPPFNKTAVFQFRFGNVIK